MTIAEKLKKEGKEEMVKNMLREGISVQKIIEVSELSEEEIKKLQEEVQH